MEIVRKLGNGAFGTTYLIRKESGDEYVLKVIDIVRARRKGMNIEILMEEINALIELSSNPHCYPYIACYYEYRIIKFKGRDSLCILSEYINGPTLEEMINRMKSGLVGGKVLAMEAKQLWEYIYQLISAVNYIHKMGYAHRDIKPGNIMLDTMHNRMKLIDFGFACKTHCDEKVGTIYWMSPELFSEQHIATLKSAQLHDIWSLGVALYELANLKMPYNLSEALTTTDIKIIIEDTPIKSNYPDKHINTLINSMLTKFWKRRPTAQALLDYLELSM